MRRLATSHCTFSEGSFKFFGTATKPTTGAPRPIGEPMPVVFSSLFESECIAFLDRNPSRNLIIDRDLFSGRFNVLDAS